MLVNRKTGYPASDLWGPVHEQIIEHGKSLHDGSFTCVTTDGVAVCGLHVPDTEPVILPLKNEWMWREDSQEVTGKGKPRAG
jgi:hypothetical protein